MFNMADEEWQHRYNNNIGKQRIADILRQHVRRQKYAGQIKQVINCRIGKKFVADIFMAEADQRDKQHSYNADNLKNRRIYGYGRRHAVRPKADKAIQPDKRNQIADQKYQRIFQTGIDWRYPVMERPYRQPGDKSEKDAEPDTVFRTAVQLQATSRIQRNIIPVEIIHCQNCNQQKQRTDKVIEAETD